MKSICICSVYIGNLPNTFDFWANSVRNNPTINFILFTDQKIDEIKLPYNLKVVNITFEEVKKRIQALFKFPISLKTPYKLCDYKPTYGNAFYDYFIGYDFWGYADLDLVFGNLRHFLTDDVLNKYDKIYHQAHLSLYRNCEKMNYLYLTILPHGKAYDYKFVYTTEHPCYFDEHCGIERIMKYNNEKLYFWQMGLDNGILADIPPFSLKFKFKYNGKYLTNTYFVYNNGELNLYSDQYMLPVVYAHFAKRKFEVMTNDVNHFKIVPNKYINMDSKVPVVSMEDDYVYSKRFMKQFKINKIKRAFRLGIFKYIEKIMRKQRFMPL